MRFRTASKLFLILFLGLISSHGVKGQSLSMPDYWNTMERLYNMVRERQSVQEEIFTLGAADPDSLASQLLDQNKRKAFWINLYNSMLQMELRQYPELWGSKQFYRTRKLFRIAYRDISLDDIENKILRPHGKKKLFSARYWRKLRVAPGDDRLYFALNCGARSCPPIRFYTAHNLDAQLDSAAADFLRENAYYDAVSQEVKLPAIIRKHRRAFGGDKGIRNMLVRYGILTTETRNARLTYQEFDGTMWENNYQ